MEQEHLDTYGARLEAAIEHLRRKRPELGASVRSRLSAECGVTVQAISQAIKSGGTLTTIASVKAARFLGVEHDWLALGEGPMVGGPGAHSQMAADIVGWFDAIRDTELRHRNYAIIHQLLVFGRWPEPPDSRDQPAERAPDRTAKRPPRGGGRG